MGKTVDNVNHPKHYADNCSIECIDSMLLAFGPADIAKYCIINAYKYIWRCKSKNGLEDIEKAKWYLNKFFSLYSDWDFEEETDELKKYHEKAEHMVDTIIPNLEKSF